MGLSIPVFYGSVRTARQGIKAAKFLVNEIRERGHDPVLVDAKAYDLPMLDKMYKEYKPGEAPEAMEKLAEICRQGDGFIIVSGEYNHSIPPALKNMLDHFQQEYLFKPSGIACYSAGAFGGVRVAMHLRALLCELGMPSVSSIFPVPKVQENFDEEGNTENTLLHKSAGRFLDEFVWYTEALKAARAKGTPF